MKRTIAIASLLAVLVTGACSNSEADTDPVGVATADIGRSQAVSGDGWEADVTVADLVVREMDYYGEIKPEVQYRVDVSVKSATGNVPISSTSFSATAEDGTSPALSIGGESDELAAGDLPQGQARSGKVTWTAPPGLRISKIDFLDASFQPVATWTVSTSPASAPPSRMPNHDEILVSRIEAPTSTSEAPVPTWVEAPTVVATTEAVAPVTPEVPIGLTGAPNVAPAPLPGKVIDHCMTGPNYQRGTTAFTDGTTGWTQQCAG